MLELGKGVPGYDRMAKSNAASAQGGDRHVDESCEPPKKSRKVEKHHSSKASKRRRAPFAGVTCDLGKPKLFRASIEPPSRGQSLDEIELGIFASEEEAAEAFDVRISAL